MIVAFKKEFEGLNSSSIIDRLDLNSDRLIRYGVYRGSDHDVLVSNTSNDEIIVDNGHCKDVYTILGEKEYPHNWLQQPSMSRRNLIYYVSSRFIRLPMMKEMYDFDTHVPVPQAIVIDVELGNRRLCQILMYALSNAVPIISTVDIVSETIGAMIYRCRRDTLARTVSDVLKDRWFAERVISRTTNAVTSKDSIDGTISWFVGSSAEISFL